MYENLTFNDFPNICRLCLNKIFLINTSNMLEHYCSIIHKITNLKITENDWLPKQICPQCHGSLEAIRNFIDSCNKNNEVLLNIQKKQDFTDDYSSVQSNLNSMDDLNSVKDDSDGDTYVVPKKQFKSEKKTEVKQQFEARHDLHCPQCRNKFGSQTEFKNHLMDGQYCMYSNGIACSVCSFMATCKEALKTHDNASHKVGKKWKCGQCNKLYSKKFNLRLHLIQTHEGTKPFHCPTCNIRFVTQRSLNRHNESMHKTDTRILFECYICEKIFNRKDNLVTHMSRNHIKKQNFNKVVEAVDKFSCRICNKTFSMPSYLENHLKMHTSKSKEPEMKNIKSGFKRFRFLTTSTLCSICGKYLPNKKAYYNHMRRKHSDIGYKPNIYSPSSNSDHFQCVICGKVMTKFQNLKTHMRIHSGDQPYPCKFHKGNKPYHCIQCNRGFTQRSSLRKHMRSLIHKQTSDDSVYEDPISKPDISGQTLDLLRQISGVSLCQDSMLKQTTAEVSEVSLYQDPVFNKQTSDLSGLPSIYHDPIFEQASDVSSPMSVYNDPIFKDSSDPSVLPSVYHDPIYKQTSDVSDLLSVFQDSIQKQTVDVSCLSMIYQDSLYSTYSI